MIVSARALGEVRVGVQVELRVERGHDLLGAVPADELARLEVPQCQRGLAGQVQGEDLPELLGGACERATQRCTFLRTSGQSAADDPSQAGGGSSRRLEVTPRSEAAAGAAPRSRRSRRAADSSSGVPMRRRRG